MHTSNILRTSVGAMACFAVVLFAGSRGSNGGVSLRGGSPNKSLGARAATRRALLKTLVYGARKINRRRLQETVVNCTKVDKIAHDAIDCIYHRNVFEGDETQAHCVGRALVADGAYSSDSALVSVLENNAELLNADDITFPEHDAVALAGSMTTLCAVPSDSEGDRRFRGLSSAEPSEAGITQETFVNSLITRWDLSAARSPSSSQSSSGRRRTWCHTFR